MSVSNVQNIIRKAVSDVVFRELLLNHPEQALADYDLTGDERTNLSNLDKAVFDGSAGDLEERLSRAGGGGWDGN